jgi:predicted nucleic acid-binding protein
VILVDTSVWIDHLRTGEARLATLLTEGLVLLHPLVIEELACGNLSRRAELLDLLHALPKPPVASHGEVVALILGENLYGTGIGAGDVHLLASARLGHARIWSRDKALWRAAKRLGLQAQEG